MSKLATFFHGSDTQWGVFYPRTYLLAAFANWERAQSARRKFTNGGYPDEDVIAVSGGEVVNFADEYLKKHGLWTVFMTEVSRFIDTEATYADHDLELARRGAAFVAIRCPTDEEKNRAWQLLSPLEPLVARYYGADGVEHFTGER